MNKRNQKVTIVKSHISPFSKKSDSYVGDIYNLKLLHVDGSLEIEYASVYEYHLCIDNERPARYSDVYANAITRDNVKWKPLEMEKFNKKLREELEESNLIVCENEIIKNFLGELLDADKVIVSLHQKKNE